MIDSDFINDFCFPYSGERIFNMLKEPAATGEPPISHKSMLELVQIADAGRMAQEGGAKVYLEEVAETLCLQLRLQWGERLPIHTHNVNS